MKRREFLQTAAGFVIVGGLVPFISTTARASEDECDSEPVDEAGAIKSFAFYQGLGVNEARDPRRTDGTYYKMPCISSADIEACTEKSYTFWHGHDKDIHQFTLTPANFAQLKAGQKIEIYTSIVQGHRHALRIDPAEACQLDFVE